jgi:hypothetical protein
MSELGLSRGGEGETKCRERLGGLSISCYRVPHEESMIRVSGHDGMRVSSRVKSGVPVSLLRARVFVRFFKENKKNPLYLRCGFGAKYFRSLSICFAIWQGIEDPFPSIET